MHVPAQRTSSRTVVAVVGSADRDAVVAAATDRAARESASLVVYAVEAAHAFSRIRPTWWSADAAGVDGVLTPVQLEVLGQHDLALAVQRARLAGVDSYGWLPTQRGAAGVTRYVREHPADVVMAGPANAALVEGLPGAVVTR